MSNEHLVLVCGTSGTGKSASLMNIDRPEGVIYLNTESGKQLPFKSKFKQFTITDPYQIYQAFEEAEKMDNVHTIVVDSLVFMMDQFESVHVLGSSNTMQQWGAYGQFFKNLLNQYVANSTKNVVFTSHVMDVLNESEMSMERLVKVKGALMNTGIEAFFSTVIGTKKVPLKTLAKYENDLLTITDQDEMLGYKHCFQVNLTKETINERLRAPLGMWKLNETFINNDIQLVINRLEEYYA